VGHVEKSVCLRPYRPEALDCDPLTPAQIVLCSASLLQSSGLRPLGTEPKSVSAEWGGRPTALFS
jgi:hypothetical protein